MIKAKLFVSHFALLYIRGISAARDFCPIRHALSNATEPGCNGILLEHTLDIGCRRNSVVRRESLFETFCSARTFGP